MVSINPKSSYSGPGTYRISYIRYMCDWGYANSSEVYISSLDDLEDVLVRFYSVYELTEIKRIH